MTQLFVCVCESHIIKIEQGKFHWIVHTLSIEDVIKCLMISRSVYDT